MTRSISLTSLPSVILSPRKEEIVLRLESLLNELDELHTNLVRPSEVYYTLVEGVEELISAIKEGEELKAGYWGDQYTWEEIPLQAVLDSAHSAMYGSSMSLKYSTMYKDEMIQTYDILCKYADLTVGKEWLLKYWLLRAHDLAYIEVNTRRKMIEEALEAEELILAGVPLLYMDYDPEVSYSSECFCLGLMRYLKGKKLLKKINVDGMLQMRIYSGFYTVTTVLLGGDEHVLDWGHVAPQSLRGEIRYYQRNWERLLEPNADPDDFEPGELSARYASAVKKLKGYTVSLSTVYGAVRDSEGRI